MKKTPAIAVMALAAMGVCAGSVADSDSGISVRPLTGRLYLVEDSHYVKTNSLVYIGPSYVTVIGASWTPATAKELAARVREITRLPIREVIDTSPDAEWSGGNGYWKKIGAKVIAMEVTTDLLKLKWGATVEAFRRSHPDYPRVPLVLPTESHPEHFELQDGHVRVFYLGPSHTAGDVFVYFPQERVLDAGSILKEQLGNLAKADLAEYPRTLQKLQALHLDIRTILSGHWSAVHGPDLIDHYAQLLKDHEPGGEQRGPQLSPRQ